MGAFLSNAGSFEQPGAMAIAAFVVERDRRRNIADGTTPQCPEKSKQLLLSSRPPTQSQKPPDRPDTADNRHECPKPRRNRASTARTAQRHVRPFPLRDPTAPLSIPASSKRQSTRSQSQIPLCSSVPDLPNIPIPSTPVPRVKSMKVRSKSMVRPTTMPSSHRAPLRHRTMPARPATTERAHCRLLGELYSLDIPAADIALVVKAMRGDGTIDEEAVLLQRLYTLSVPSWLIAQVVDAMRAGHASAQAEELCNVHANGHGILDDAPPVYEYEVP